MPLPESVPDHGGQFPLCLDEVRGVHTLQPQVSEFLEEGLREGCGGYKLLKLSVSLGGKETPGKQHGGVGGTGLRCGVCL